nr:McrC family protein [Micromonospora purpureochromogenes]
MSLGLAVLAETEHTASSRGHRRSDPVELSIPTDALWETIVHQVLLSAGFDRVLDQRSQPTGLVVDPWVANPATTASTHPDNVAVAGTDIWIVDAKYKMLTAGAAPSREDQYQMFAYSHLVADPGLTVRGAVLIYPGHPSTRRWRRGRDEPGSAQHLIATTIPFPRPEQVRNPTVWQSYLDEAAAYFRLGF